MAGSSAAFAPQQGMLDITGTVIGLGRMGDCQNYGPFLGPYYNTGPNTGPNLRDPKRDHNFDNPPDVRMISVSMMTISLVLSLQLRRPRYKFRRPCYASFTMITKCCQSGSCSECLKVLN